MPISLIPRKKTKEKIKIKLDKKSWIFIETLLFLFFVFGMLEVYQIFQSSSLKNINADITKMDEKIDTELEEEIQIGIKNLNQAKILLESRIKIENIFKFLEENTFSKVRFSNFDFNVEENEILLQGTVTNALPLIIQVSILKQLDEIKKVEVGKIIISKEGVEFQLKLKINHNSFISAKNKLNQFI